MTRRSGQLTRVALRLGLLLGGVVAAWGAHEIATADAAYAADRPAPVSATVDLVTGVLGPLLGSEPVTGPGHPAPATDVHPPAPAPPSRSTPERPTQVTGAPWSRHRPAHRPARHTPTDRPSAPAGRPGPPTSANDPIRPTTRPAHAVPAPAGPATGTRRPVTELAGVLGPVAGALRPVTDPIREDLLAPVADALRPVTGPLGSIVALAWDALKPVRDPLDPVLGPLYPGSEVPPAAPPAPADQLGGPPSPSRPVVDPVPAAVPGHAASTPAWSNTASDGPAPGRPGRPDHPRPLRSDLAHRPGTYTPGTHNPDTAGAGHGELADAAAPGWAPPAEWGRRCHPTGGGLLPSRSPRPGTRPA